MAEQFARYVVMGGGATLAHYVVVFRLVQMGVSPWRASVVGSVIGATRNHVISRQAVFNSTRGHIGAMLRFGEVAFLALGCNATIMAVGLARGLYCLIAQVFASAITAIFNCLVHRHWTFRDAAAVGGPTARCVAPTGQYALLINAGWRRCAGSGRFRW